MSGEALRELPPGQDTISKRVSFRLVPLCMLVVAVLVMAVIGVVHKSNQSPLGEGVPQSTAAAAEPLPAACAPAFDSGANDDAWTSDAAASEQVWQQHVGDVGGYTMQGDDGYLLLGEDHWHNISQSVGRNPIDAERIEAWYAYLNNMRADFEAAGTDLYVIVAPAKWQIMPETLPDWAEGIRGETNLDILMQAHPELPWIDVRPAMQETAADTPLYTPLNSHWTDYGAYVAFEQVLTCLSAEDERFASVSAPATTGTTMIADNNEFVVAGDSTEPGLTFSQPVYADDLGTMQVTSADGTESVEPVNTGFDMLELPLSTVNDHAATDLTAVLLRDSTGTAIDPLVQATFSGTEQLRHNIDDPRNMPDIATVAADADADVAFLVVTQRFLDIVPGVVS